MWNWTELPLCVWTRCTLALCRTACVVCAVDYKHVRGSYRAEELLLWQPHPPLCSTGASTPHPIPLFASLLPCCALPLLRGLGVAGPIISPWISLRRVSAELIELGFGSSSGSGSNRAELCDPLTSKPALALHGGRRQKHTAHVIPHENITYWHIYIFFIKSTSNLIALISDVL